MGLEIEAVAKIKEINVKQIRRNGNRSRGKEHRKSQERKRKYKIAQSMFSQNLNNLGI